MPVYTYECDECGVRFDLRQKFSDDPASECPECGGHVHRVPQPVGIVFKGSGWYVKDSKGQNNLATPGKRERENGDAPSSDKGEAKSESAPAKAEAPAAPAKESGKDSAAKPAKTE
jgi:putative FmdB family regulatory protein